MWWRQKQKKKSREDEYQSIAEAETPQAKLHQITYDIQQQPSFEPPTPLKKQHSELLTDKNNEDIVNCAKKKNSSQGTTEQHTNTR